MSSRKKLKMVASSMEVAVGEAARAEQASAGFPAARAAPDPEARAIAKRRQFSAAYKLWVLAQADQGSGTGAIGGLLRREGLYSSHRSTWRCERDAGAIEAFSRRGGRKAHSTPEQKRVAVLEAKNARLQRELEQARLIIEVQKKLCMLLGLPTTEDKPTGSESGARSPNSCRKSPRAGYYAPWAPRTQRGIGVVSRELRGCVAGRCRRRWRSRRLSAGRSWRYSTAIALPM